MMHEANKRLPPTPEDLRAATMSEEQLIFRLTAELRRLPIGATLPLEVGSAADLGLPPAPPPYTAALPWPPAVRITVRPSADPDGDEDRVYETYAVSPYFSGRIVAPDALAAAWFALQTLDGFPRTIYRWFQH